MCDPKKEKPYCGLSLDLDNQWAYMKIHGDAGWQSFPSYLDIFIPHILEILDALRLKITFFVVGQDAALSWNHPFLRSIVEHGHEIGNHSFHHESWLHLYSRNEIEKEVIQAEEHITNATGQRPLGFRGPGFTWSRNLFEVLTERGYLYDASTLPTYIGPLARKFYFFKSNLSRVEKKERRELFGKFRDGMRPIKPYFWDVGRNKTLLEIPVTTMPIFRIPFHLSYLIYLSRISTRLMRFYLYSALSLCRITRTEPSFLLHPLDLIGGDKIPQLAFFPGMDISSHEKVKLFITVLNRIAVKFSPVPMSAYAALLYQGKTMGKKRVGGQQYSLIS
ncbi:polysaccharide deacetylase family protein [bacterium]|nr:polysaccharide deacetylase family protein [bacterium]